MATGEIFQLSVSRGGVPKHAIRGGRVGPLGLEGDRQADLRAHGGPERALCLWSLEVIARMCDEGHNLSPGAAGENVTVMGLDWTKVVPGSRIRLAADVMVEVTGYTEPCWKNARWFRDGNFNRMAHDLHPGEARVYARVIQGGEITQGDRVELIDENASDRAWRLQPATYRWPQDFG